MDPAIFLDRDGVIIENREDYVRSWADVAFISGSAAAIAAFSAAGFKVVVVTNQSVVGRGLLTAAGLDEINRRILEVVSQAGGRIDAIYSCPHMPEQVCACRKPRPGMILQAGSELNLDLSRSVMIGDAISDIEAGMAARVGVNILVRTGRGAAQLRLAQAARISPLLVHDTLALAAAAILAGDLRPE